MRPTSRKEDIDEEEFKGNYASTKSTSTSTSSFVAAARTTVRILCAVRPRRPITRPRSPGPTRTSSRILSPLPGPDVTATASASSTMLRTMWVSTAIAMGASSEFASRSDTGLLGLCSGELFPCTTNFKKLADTLCGLCALHQPLHCLVIVDCNG